MDEWKATEAGLFTNSKTFSPERVDMLLSVNVFNFSDCVRSVKIGTSQERTCLYHFGVQFRFLDPLTFAHIITASSNPSSPQCTYLNTEQLPLFGGPDYPFDQSAVYQAAVKAMHCAMQKAF